MKENLDHLPKICKSIRDDDGEECGRDITNIHRMYRSMGFCEEHWCENANALWVEFDSDCYDDSDSNYQVESCEEFE